MARRKSFQKGSVEQKGKNAFKVRWWAMGIRRDGSIGLIHPSRTLKGVTKAAAWKFLSEQIEKDNRNPGDPRGKMRLDQFVREHYQPTKFGDRATGKRRKLRPSTQRGYRSAFSGIMEQFGSVPLCEIETAAVQDYLDLLSSQLSTQSLKNIRNCLSAILTLAWRWRWIEQNPVRLTEVPRGAPSRRRKPVALTAKQVRGLLGQVTGRDYALLALAVATGMRRGELVGLRVSVVDLEKAVLYVNEARVDGEFGEPKTENGRRELPLPLRLVEILRQHLSATWMPNADNLLFVSKNGTPLHPDNYLARVIKRAAKLANLFPVNWQDLRTTHATLIRDLLREHLIRAQMGHAPNGVTMRHYVKHHSPELRRDAIEQVWRLLYPGCTSEVVKGGKEEQEKVPKTDQFIPQLAPMLTDTVQ